MREDLSEQRAQAQEQFRSQKKKIFPNFLLQKPPKAGESPVEDKGEWSAKMSSKMQAEYVIDGYELQNENARQRVLSNLLTKQPRKSSQEGDLLKEYCKLPVALVDEDQTNTWKIIRRNLVAEAHEGEITTIEVNRMWNMVITGDNKGICKIWDLEKMSLLKTIYTHHFADSQIYEKSVWKKGEEELFIDVNKRSVEREKIRGISIADANGDFCVVSSHYVSIFTVNGVLVGMISNKEASVPEFQTALLTKNRYTDEDNFLITGHRQGLVSFWTFKESRMWKELSENKTQRDEILSGKFGHTYERSLYINKLVKMADFHKIYECNPVPNATKNSGERQKVTSLLLSRDQTKLLVSLRSGEIFCFRKKIEESSKGCSWCGVPIGLVDAKTTCSLCQKTFCAGCSGAEEFVSSVNLWKKAKICPGCIIHQNTKSTDSLYNFY